MVEFTALWDTGATNSVITQNVVDACGLKPTGFGSIFHAQGESRNIERFLVNIGLPNNVAFPGLPVTLGVLISADILIGMDIIGRGDFAVSNFNGRTKFSFRFPSQRDIDFVKESKE